ncbi:MAG TPA: SsrA-binding protein SmpB [Rectinemataceae bacterium]|nr:SsrA-binding protein SmpB [Rectinemataceae bacterium]
MSRPEGVKVVALNRRARFDYTVDETFECGIVLLGTEVKSIKDGRVSFPDAFAEVRSGEVWLRGFRVAQYGFSSVFNHDPERLKKLLLHAQEIKRIDRRVREKGYTLIPLSIYLKNGLIKIELGLCKGKKQYDKRADIKERDVERDLRRDFRKRGED